MNILLTGVAGYIGSNAAEFLLANGHTVYGLDIFDDYYPRKIKEFNISSFREHSNFTLFEIDICDRVKLEEIFKQHNFDVIIHLAARAGVTYSLKNPYVYATNNYVGTSNLAEFAVKYNVKKIVFASTSSVYGNNNKVPFKEDMLTDAPAAPYPASKKGCEVLLYTYNLNYGLDVVVFRFFNPLGPKARPDSALAKLVRAALCDGEFPVYQNVNDTARDYTYINHMLEAIQNTFDKSFGYEIINLGNSNPVTLIDMLNAVELVTGKKIKLVETPLPGQMEITKADISKAKNLVGYNPVTTLPEMVKIYYEWFIKQPEWYQKGEY